MSDRDYDECLTVVNNTESCQSRYTFTMFIRTIYSTVAMHGVVTPLSLKLGLHENGFSAPRFVWVEDYIRHRGHLIPVLSRQRGLRRDLHLQ